MPIYEPKGYKVYQGEIELIIIGDSISYHMIVTGKCRGEVWNFTYESSSTASLSD